MHGERESILSFVSHLKEYFSYFVISYVLYFYRKFVKNESYNRNIQLTISNLQVRTDQVEMSGYTNRILTNIGYSVIMLRKTYHGREKQYIHDLV